MKTLKFKTNIECTQSVANVSNFIDNTDGIKNWEIDLWSPDKVLTIRGNVNRPGTLVKRVHRAGYQITQMG